MLVDPISPAMVRGQLERILSSKEFRSSAYLRRFLRHAVELTLEGEAVRLKESILGVELFGRPATFDPRVDPIVRVQAVKLRSRLQRYYAAEGSADPILIDFPKGGYVPVFRRREAETSPVTSMPQVLVHRRARLWVALLIGGLGVGLLMWRQIVRSAMDSEWRFTRLAFTTGATSAFPAISRQGNLVAFASDRGQTRQLDIFVQVLGVDEPVPLTSHPAKDRQPDFSPEGGRIVFQSDREEGGIYVVSLLSRRERKVAARGYWPRFSPDGTRIAFQGGDGKLYVVPAFGGEPRTVATDVDYARDPIWTPDGRHLLVLTGDEARGFDWRVLPAAGGRSASTGAARVFRRFGLGTRNYPPIPGDWVGNALVFSAGKRGTTTSNIWWLRLPPETLRVAGEPVQITSGPGPDTFPRAVQTPDGGIRIAFTRENLTTHLWWLAPTAEEPNNPTGGERLTDDPELVMSSLNAVAQLSADGAKLAYCSGRFGNPDVFWRDLTTGREAAVARNPWPEQSPVISPDGTSVAYVAEEVGGQVLYLWTEGGGPTKRLCADCGRPLIWTPDGGSLLLASGNPARLSILKVANLEVRDPLPGRRYRLVEASLSHDGGWIALRTEEPVEPGCPSAFLTSFPSGLSRPCPEWVPLPEMDRVSRLSWSPDGGTLFAIATRDGFACLWSQALDPLTKRPIGGLTAVRHFHHHQRRLFSEGGIAVRANRVAAWLGESSSGVWMAESDPESGRAISR